MGLAWSSPAGGGGGLSGLGSTDNALLRADGTDGDAAQGSGVTLNDDDEMLFPGANDDTPNMIQGLSSGQGMGYNTGSSRVTLCMSAVAKVMVANTFVRADETFLINDSAQSSTVPGLCSPFATTTGLSVTTGGNLYLIGASTSIAHITSASMAMSSYLTLYNRTDANRGSAGTAGRVIFNTDDGQLNVDDGTNWTLPDGTTT